MSDDIKQIYHVSRCGSTLMGSLLSTVIPCYLEPKYGIEIANRGIVPEKYKNKAIKFQSLSLMNPILLKGKKVFLYRPLLQHLYKIKSVKSEWFHHRTNLLREMVKKNNKFEGIWAPISNIDLIAYQWLCSVFEMMNHSNVLWIQTNDFLKNKKNVMHKVCDYFELNRVVDFSICDINVKKANIRKLDMFCDLSNISNKEFVSENHGIIDNEICIKDSQIVELEEKIKKLFSFTEKIVR